MRARSLSLAIGIGWVVHLALHALALQAMYDGHIVSQLLAPSAATSLGALAFALGFLYLRIAAHGLFPALLAASLSYWACTLLGQRLSRHSASGRPG